MPGKAPCRAAAAAHARRRAAVTAAVSLPSARSPPRAISSSVRHAVGTEATSPNRSSWSPITRKSLITSAPSAIAHAKSASTRPRSCTSSRSDTSAFDSPAVRPMLSASALISATPACDTIPVPSAVTFRPFSQPVVFTYQVLHDLGRYGSQQPLSSQVRSTFHGCRTGQLTRRREFAGLAGLPLLGHLPNLGRRACRAFRGGFECPFLRHLGWPGGRSCVSAGCLFPACQPAPRGRARNRAAGSGRAEIFAHPRPPVVPGVRRRFARLCGAAGKHLARLGCPVAGPVLCAALTAGRREGPADALAATET